MLLEIHSTPQKKSADPQPMQIGSSHPRQKGSDPNRSLILTAFFTLFATFPVLTSFPCPNLPKRWSRIDNPKYRSRSSIVPGMTSTLRVNRVQLQVYLVFEVIRNHPVLKLQRIAKGLQKDTRPSALYGKVSPCTNILNLPRNQIIKR